MSSRSSLYGTYQKQNVRMVRPGSRRPSRPATSSTRLRGPVDQEEGVFTSTGLTFRSVGQQTIRLWITFQALALFWQWCLWSEVRTHLNLYEDTMALHCNPSHTRHAICMGPLWNLSFWQEVVLEGKGREYERQHRALEDLRKRSHTHLRVTGPNAYRYDSVEAIDNQIKEVEAETALRIQELRVRRAQLQLRENPFLASTEASSNVTAESVALTKNGSFYFEFKTFSAPPTFLVTVDPITKAHRTDQVPPPSAEPGSLDEQEARSYRRWYLALSRKDPLQLDHHYDREHMGPENVAFQDLSEEAVNAVAKQGSVVWRADVLNGDPSALQTRFVINVEEFTAPHLEQIHANSQCSFISSWKAFNQQHQGQAHQVLSWCDFLLGVFLPLGAVACIVMHRSLQAPDPSSNFEETDDSLETCCHKYSFHALVLTKFVVVDIPQQTCMVLYLLGWYDTGGLRCQLCLFHADQCQLEPPFNVSNAIAILCTLVSSVSNQILLGPVMKKSVSPDSACLSATVRVGLACASILPFTTGMYWASSSILAAPMLVHALVFTPCIAGWATVVSLFLCGCIACCNQCEDM